MQKDTRIKNLKISYKDRTPFNQYYPSILLDDMNYQIILNLRLKCSSNLVKYLKKTQIHNQEYLKIIDIVSKSIDLLKKLDCLEVEVNVDFYVYRKMLEKGKE